MNRSREAISTIKGYYFQFDHFILQLLQLKTDDESVQIEGIEDVDIITPDETKAIQCKYYDKVKCIPSVIGKAIRPMLLHFVEHREDVVHYRYSLFAHYSSGCETIQIPLTVDYVKQHFLTYVEHGKTHELHVEKNLSDSDLGSFLERLNLRLNADTYEEQIEKIVNQLQKFIPCDEYEARYFYYTNALSFVKRIAVEKNSSSRKVSKKRFREEICMKQRLFDKWYIEHVGFEKFYKDTRRKFFAKLNVPCVNRIFLIECDDAIKDAELAELLIRISENWSKLSKREIESESFCPYVHLYGLSEIRLAKVKEMLLQNGIHIWDGYEFKDAMFSLASLTRHVNYHVGVRLKLINEFSQIDAVFDTCTGRKIVFQFYLNKPFYENSVAVNKSFLVQSTIDVNQII